MERVRFLEHNGQQILLLDYTDCVPEDIFDIMERCERIVTASPRQSVLTLSDFTNAHFSRPALQRMKEVAALDRPHVRRAAFVGAESLPKTIYTAIGTFSARSFPTFPTREAALAWLTAADEQNEAATGT